MSPLAEWIERRGFILLLGVLALGALIRTCFFTGVGEPDARLLHQTILSPQPGISLITPWAVVLFVKSCLGVFGTLPVTIWGAFFLLSLLQIMLLYSVGYRLFQSRFAGVLSALLCAVWAPEIFSATRVSGSLVAGTFVSLGLWILLADTECGNGRIVRLAVSGLLIGVACWCGPWGWMLLPLSFFLPAYVSSKHHLPWKKSLYFYAGWCAALLLVPLIVAVLGVNSSVSVSGVEPGVQLHASLPKTLYPALLACFILMIYGKSEDRLVAFWLLVPTGASLILGSMGMQAFSFLRNPEDLAAVSAPLALALARVFELMYKAPGLGRSAFKSVLLAFCLLLFVDDWGNLFEDQERYTARTRFMPDVASLISGNPHIPVWADAGAFSYLSLLTGGSENRVLPLAVGSDLPTGPKYMIITEALERDKAFRPAAETGRPEARTVRIYRKGLACAAVLYDGDPSVIPAPTYEETGSSVALWARSVVGVGSPKYLTELNPAVPVKGVIAHFFSPEICAGTLSLAGTLYANGIRMRSNSSAVYRLDGRFKGLEAVVGLDDKEKSTTKIVVFSVIGDKKQLAQTQWIKSGEPPRRILVNLRGVHELELSVVNRGDVFQTLFGDWASIFIY